MVASTLRLLNEVSQKARGNTATEAIPARSLREGGFESAVVTLSVEPRIFSRPRDRRQTAATASPFARRIKMINESEALLEQARQGDATAAGRLLES